MIDWIRPSGTQITTNDAHHTVKYCESLGWKRATKLEMKTNPAIKTEKTTFISKIKQMLG